jgi:hypothetical protein
LHLREIDPDSIYGVLPHWKKDETFAAALARSNVRWLYLDPEAWVILKSTGRSDADIGFFFESVPPGWKVVASDPTMTTPGPWWLYHRP